MEKPAATDHHIHPLIAARWSPRALSADPALTDEEVARLFEAARWAPSSGNSQPWGYVYGLAGTPGFDTILGCLVPGNASWCARAGALVIACARTEDDKGEPIRHCDHDLGLSVAMMLLEATAIGLAIHPMAGFEPEKAAEVLSIPAPWRPTTAIAIGRPAPLDVLSDRLRDRELAPRVRKPQAEIAFRDRWAG